MIKRRRKLRSETKCWSCIHSSPCPEKGIGCEWSVCSIPVPGWTAVKTGTSYFVVECKKYQEEVRKCGRIL